MIPRRKMDQAGVGGVAIGGDVLVAVPLTTSTELPYRCAADVGFAAEIDSLNPLNAQPVSSTFANDTLWYGQFRSQHGVIFLSRTCKNTIEPVFWGHSRHTRSQQPVHFALA